LNHIEILTTYKNTSSSKSKYSHKLKIKVHLNVVPIQQGDVSHPLSKEVVIQPPIMHYPNQVQIKEHDFCSLTQMKILFKNNTRIIQYISDD